MGSRAGGVSVEWATRGVLESLVLSGSGDVPDSTRVAASVALVSERRQGLIEPVPSLVCWCQAPESTLRHLWTTQNVRRRSAVFVSSVLLGRVCGARAPAMLVHTVSLGAGVLRALLERASSILSAT
eukprot:scaffold11423_cov123-Isochrysis_galbana.AAC.1